MSRMSQLVHVVETENSAAVREDLIKEFRTSFSEDPLAKIGQNCLTRTSVKDLTINQSVLQNTDVNVFSHKVDGWGVTNQKKSGRCWLFAMLNLIKKDTAKKLNVKEFEFSQSYVQFFDKLERSNHFLEAMITTADREIDRTIDYLLKNPIGNIYEIKINNTYFPCSILYRRWWTVVYGCKHCSKAWSSSL